MSQGDVHLLIFTHLLQKDQLIFHQEVRIQDQKVQKDLFPQDALLKEKAIYVSVYNYIFCKISAVSSTNCSKSMSAESS